MNSSETTGIRIFQGTLLGFGILAFGFMGLVGYYVWQLKFGNPVALQQTITQGQFTENTGASSARPRINEDITTFIRPDNPTLGSANAPITILAFIDFECPFCQRAYPTFERVVNEFGPAVRVVFKHFPLTQIHPRSNQASLAAACAHEQGKFWPYYRAIFEGKRLDSASLERYAQRTGLRIDAFSTCLSRETHQAIIDADIQDGIAAGARGTPTYLVNQTRVEGVIDYESWRDVIIVELQQNP